MTALLGACAGVTSGIFARMDVACGETVLVFSNAEKYDEKVVVKAADECAGLDSALQLLDPDGKVIKSYPIPDKTTQAIRLIVPTGDYLNLVCAGSEGGCWYSVSGE